MKITKVEFQALLDKYLNGLASPDETKLLDQFFDSYHKKPVAVGEVTEEIKEEILQNIQATIGVDIRNPDSKGRGLQVWLRAAAVVSFVLIASYFLLDRFGLQEKKTQSLVAKLKEVRASKGQKLDIRLPDGSRIQLNANSTISYPEKFAGEIREVTLKGEAYFDVTHIPSRPFIVRTTYASTQVLGTSFNILHADEAYNHHAGRG